MLEVMVKKGRAHLLNLDEQDVRWFARMGLIRPGTTGLLEDDGPETLPFFDDYELSPEHLKSMRELSSERRKQLKSTPGFSSRSLDKLERLLACDETLLVVCD